MNKEQLQQEYLDGRRDFSNLDLSGLDLTGINLEGANLTGAELSAANLRVANFVGANLTGTNLSGACLNSANLANANLTRVNLSNAYLNWTNFTNANLTNAYLVNIEFEQTNFKGANLQGIQFEGTLFVSANLFEAKNLPSPIFSPLFVPENHPDADLVYSIRSVTEGLLCFSESEYPYDIFLWNRVIRGKLTLEQLLQEMGHLKRINIQSLQSANSENQETARFYQFLLDKIQAELFDLEIYQFENRDTKEHCSELGIPYIIMGRTVLGDWFAAMIVIDDIRRQYEGGTGISIVTEMSEKLGKNDAAMTKAEHLNLISAVEEAGAEIEELVWSLAEDRDLMLHKLLLAADLFIIKGIEYCNHVIQEDYYEDYEEDDIGEEEKLEQKKIKVFAQFVRNNLSNIRICFVGGCNIDIYLIGETQNQDWLGIHTRVTWT